MPQSLITLPPPRINSQVSLETTIAQRCLVGPYAEEQLTGEQIGQLLWAAHTTASVHKRKGINGLTWLILYVCRMDGVWRYHTQEHCLTRHLNRDVRRELADAARNRWFLAQAPCVIASSAVPRRDAERYGERWQLRYLPIEVGRAVERTLLQAVALGLTSVAVSEFDDARVSQVLILSRQETPLYLLPVGWPAQGYWLERARDA
jgi:SagB-type dehydrogenase family enzyme